MAQQPNNKSGLPDLGVLPPPDAGNTGKPYNIKGFSDKRGQLSDAAKDTDPARYIIPPGNFPRPRLTNVGVNQFTWPLGVENFDLSSNATLGVHHYIGDNDVDVTVVYPVEDHITISGLFPGYTGSANMQGLREVLTARAPEGRVLELPQLLKTSVQVVNYRFSHDTNDRTRGVAYSVEFIQVGKTKKVNPKPPNVILAKPFGSGSSTIPAKPRGSSARTYVTSQNVRTLKTVAAAVYNDPDKWKTLTDLNNIKLIDTGIPFYNWSFAQLPIGFSLTY